jgi:hypothetical protein
VKCLEDLILQFHLDPEEPIQKSFDRQLVLQRLLRHFQRFERRCCSGRKLHHGQLRVVELELEAVAVVETILPAVDVSDPVDQFLHRRFAERRIHIELVHIVALCADDKAQCQHLHTHGRCKKLQLEEDTTGTYCRCLAITLRQGAQLLQP